MREAQSAFGFSYPFQNIVHSPCAVSKLLIQRLSLLRWETGFQFDNLFFGHTGLTGLTVNKLDKLHLRLPLPSLVGLAWCIFPAFPRAES